MATHTNTYKAEQSASSKRLKVGQELDLVRAALRAHGIELADAGDEGFYVRVTTGPTSAAFALVLGETDWKGVKMSVDPLKIVLLRGHAASMWARYPAMTQGAIEQSMREHGDRIGASVAEYEAARGFPAGGTR
jgi:hypothetical protein